jgi:hypothetical protein
MQQWSLEKVKVIHGSPISIHLISLEVVAVKKKNGSVILSVSLFFSPIVQLPTTCNILIEGKEKTKLVKHDRVDQQGIGNFMFEHCFTSQVFLLEIAHHAYSFEIKVPDHLPGSMQWRKFLPHPAGRYCTRFQLDYTVQASIMHDGRKCVSLPLKPSFQQSSRGDYTHQQHSLSVQVGQRTIIPNSIFCGLLETSTRATFTLTLPSLPLQRDDSMLYLIPGRELSIQVIDGDVLPTTTSSWNVKFTETIHCREDDDSEMMSNVQHWELPLDDLTKVKIPPFRDPSFTGKLIQIHHQIIIYVVMGDLFKTVVATTPILPVKVLCSLPITKCLEKKEEI